MLPTYVYLWSTSILPFWQEGHLADRLLFLIYAIHMPFKYFEVMTKAHVWKKRWKQPSIYAKTM